MINNEFEVIQEALDNIEDYIVAIQDITKNVEQKTIQWERVYVYLESIGDEVEDVRVRVFDDFINDEGDTNEFGND